jgi:hypothetical protein
MVPPTHSPKISAGKNPPFERHSAIGRNLNARDHAAYPHRVRFPGLGTTIIQRHLNAQSYRNRPPCAAGELSRAFNSGATVHISQSCTSLSAPEFRHADWGHNAERFDFGLPSLVTFFGGAKKVTDAFKGSSGCVVLQSADSFSAEALTELSMLTEMKAIRLTVRLMLLMLAGSI